MKEVSNKNGNIFQRLANAFFSERADPIPPNSPDDDAWLGKPLNSRLEDFMDCRRGRRQEDPPQPPSGILTNKNKTHMDRYCDQPKEYNIDPKISTLQARQESAVYSSVSSSSIRSDREPGLVSRVMRMGAQPRSRSGRNTDSRQVILSGLAPLIPTCTVLITTSFRTTAGTADDLRRLPWPHTDTPRHLSTGIRPQEPMAFQAFVTKHWTRCQRAPEKRRCATRHVWMT